ncbi:MAG TPA: hypothetical protein PLM53_20130 [Spirochaetota bacterium]|nr:hypothetical protein [Spirochaetota bacterium]HPC43091.1 hypothetical protein [Spirochaetota bacterium]HPL17195.1 hypothetical protein [Spirochaetota bacterium]HQF07159.1 hypothetical protein [Spirochaetota bacterium]HQH99403.1 hypothetical protein [Spirochaetota bacterium]
MAEAKLVADLDKKLMEEGVIDPRYMDDYKKVHSMLNTHVRKTGKILSEETFDRGDQKLRKWLMVLFRQGAPQEKLSSYLRCGLAHLCFDFIESSYHAISADDLVARAIQSFKMRNFHKTYFRIAPTEVKSTSAKKKKDSRKTAKKKVKKTAPRRKSAGKKTVKKKAAKKKTVQKKIVKKKTAKKRKVPGKPRGKRKGKSRKPKRGIFARLFG